MAESNESKRIRSAIAFKSPFHAFTLVEVLIGIVVMAFAISAAATLFRSSGYSAIKARIDGRVAALVRFQSERLLYMPYSTLAALASSGSSVQSGYLYRPANGSGYGAIYPYTMTASLTLTGVGTQNEQVSVSTLIQWQEPSPDFSETGNVQKQINLGTYSRRRF